MLTLCYLSCIIYIIEYPHLPHEAALETEDENMFVALLRLAAKVLFGCAIGLLGLLWATHGLVLPGIILMLVTLVVFCFAYWDILFLSLRKHSASARVK